MAMLNSETLIVARDAFRASKVKAFLTMLGVGIAARGKVHIAGATRPGAIQR
jgi:hypothetical protein